MTPRVLSSGPPRLPRRSSDRRSAFPRPASRRRPGAGNRNRPGGAACARHGRYDSGTTGPPPWAPSARRLARLGDRAVPRNLRISRGATVDAPCIADEDARNEKVPATRRSRQREQPPGCPGGCSSSAGVPGLEPRTTVPETAVLPITPYPKRPVGLLARSPGARSTTVQHPGGPQDHPPGLGARRRRSRLRVRRRR